ncbi:MAG: SDR family NAD(P)-dependent oxidoreductase [Oscillospiraceae bacterium]
MSRNKVALVTGASSGIGREIARELNRHGYNLILCARRRERLIELKSQLKGDTVIIPCDLSDRKQCFELYDNVRDMNVSVLINNAGFGAIGKFNEIPIETEIRMIDTNCTALHILTKLFLQDFIKNDYGYILNVSSSAGLMPGGAYMSAYYASKAYVTSLTSGINEELRRMKSKVSISALCPGPVKTEFNKVANVKFNLKSISAKQCAVKAVNGMFQRKLIITPSVDMSFSAIGARLVPRKLVLPIVAYMQEKKIK